MKVPIADLKTTFFVRKALNDDYVIQLAQLYDTGVQLPPIEITKDKEIVDGRHRVSAADLAGLKEIDAIVLRETDRDTLLKRAIRTNMGGSLPPTREDIKFTIQNLLQGGWSPPMIYKAFPLPVAVMRRYYSDVMSLISKARINGAIRDMVEGGLTLVQAAKRHDVDEKVLKQAISKDKKRKPVTDHIKGSLSSRFQGMGRSTAAVCQRLFDSYMDNELTPAAVWDVLDHLDRLHDSARKRSLEWRTRFAAMIDGKEKGAA